MIDKLLAALAFLTLVAFLGILAWWVPRPDLLAVLGATVLLTGYDLFIHEHRTSREPKAEHAEIT